LRQSASQKKAAFGLYALSAGLVLLALSGVVLKGRALSLFVLGFVAMSMILIRDMRRIELWDAGCLLDSLVHDQPLGARRRWHLLRIPLILAADWLVLILSWVTVVVFLDFPITSESLRRWLLVRSMPIFLCLVLFRTYSVVWSRAQLSNYMRLIVAVLMGSALSVLLVLWGNVQLHHHLYLFTWLYASLVISGLVTVRMIRAVIRDLFYALDTGRLADQPSHEVIRTVVYGAGLRYRAFRRELVRASGSADRRRVIVGLMDDDLLLKNLFIGGLKIHGTLEQAKTILKKLNADEVVITCRLTDARRKVAHQILSGCGVSVTEWTLQEHPFGEKPAVGGEGAAI
jgi:hypothetical protein